MQLGLAPIAAPQAEQLGLGRVGHVDQPLIPPALHNGAIDGTQDQSIIPDLHEAQRTIDIGALVDGEALAVQESRAQWFQVNVVAILPRKKPKLNSSSEGL